MQTAQLQVATQNVVDHPQDLVCAQRVAELKQMWVLPIMVFLIIVTFILPTTNKMWIFNSADWIAQSLFVPGFSQQMARYFIVKGYKYVLWNICCWSIWDFGHFSLGMWRSLNLNSTTLELWTFSTNSNSTNVKSALLLNANSWKNLRSLTDFICTDSQRVRTNLFFSQIQFITQTTVIECAI